MILRRIRAPAVQFMCRVGVASSSLWNVIAPARTAHPFRRHQSSRAVASAQHISRRGARAGNASPKTRGTMPGDEIPFSRRSGAGHVDRASACAARRVCVGAAAAGIRRPLLGKSQCDAAAEFHPGVASAVCSQARFFALRVLLRIGIGGRFTECVIASGTACARGSIASARDTRVGHGHGRFAPALTRTSQSFLIG
jgi:hypothetical protein